MAREPYRRLLMDDVKRTFLGGSVASLVSFFAEEDELTQEDIEEIRCILQKRQVLSDERRRLRNEMEQERFIQIERTAFSV